MQEEKQQQQKSNSYLTFKLGKELFAAHVSKVLNILELVKITEVPKAPQYMKGVINLRGNVLPVIDTRIKFGMTATEFTKNTCILVLNVTIDDEEVDVSALVDAVQEVLEVEQDQIQPPPSIGSKYQSEFIQGMIKADEQFIMLLDMDKVFSTEEIIDIKESTQDINPEQTEQNQDNEEKQ